MSLTMGILASSMAIAAAECPVQSTADTDDAYYYNDALLLDATGYADSATITDESRYATPISVFGDAKIFSQKFEFDGSGDYLDLPNSLQFTPSSRVTFEVVGLVFDAVNTGTAQYVAARWKNASSTKCWAIYESGGHLYFSGSADGTTATTLDLGAITAATNYDLLVSWDGTTVRGYIAGAYVGSIALSTFYITVALTSTIGCRQSSAGGRDEYLDGRFTAFRMTRGAARYTHESGCGYRPKMPLPSTQASTTDVNWNAVTLLVSGGDTAAGVTFSDESPYDSAVTAGGDAQTDTAISLQGSNSILFDGTGDYLKTPDRNVVDIESSDFTIDVAIQFSNTSGTQVLIAKDDGGSTRGWALLYIAGTGLRFAWSTDGSSTSSVTQSWSPTSGTPYHVRVCRYGSTIRLWIGGIFQTSAAISGALYNNSLSVLIGARYSSGTPAAFFFGNMAEIRLTNAARNTDSSNFTAPSTPWDRG